MIITLHVRIVGLLLLFRVAVEVYASVNNS